MPPRSSSPICERSLDLTLIGIGRRDIPQCSPKHFLMQMFYRTFSSGQRPSDPGGWYTSGTKTTGTASANSGYQFSGFTGTATSTTNPLALTMNGPSTLTASFVFIPPAMNVTPSFGAGATQILTAVYIDPVAYGQITEALLLINSSAATAS